MGHDDEPHNLFNFFKNNRPSPPPTHTRFNPWLKLWPSFEAAQTCGVILLQMAQSVVGALALAQRHFASVIGI